MIGRLIAIAAASSGIGGAVTLAARARVRRWEALDVQALRSSRLLVEVGGVRLHLHAATTGALDSPGLGEGPPPLLMVHGLGGSTFSFREQLASAADGRTVLAMDLPGFGLSDRPPERDLSHTTQAARIVALMDRLGIRQAVILGHSMGGAIALRLAAAHPERVAGLVLVAAPDPNRRFSPPLFPLLPPVLSLGLALLASESRLRQELLRTVYDPAFITEEVANGYLRPLRVRGTGACLIAMLRDVRRDPPVDLAAINTPALLIWGEADRVVPASVGRRLVATLPNARLEIVERAAHLPLEEQPRACNEMIEGFVRQLRRPADATIAFDYRPKGRSASASRVSPT